MASMLNPGIQRWLEQHCDLSDAVSGGVVLRMPAGHGTPDMVAQWPAHGVPAPALASAAQAAMQRARPVVVAPTIRLVDIGPNRVISLPLRAGDRMLGAVALAVRAADTQAVERLFEALVRASADIDPSLGRDSDHAVPPDTPRTPATPATPDNPATPATPGILDTPATPAHVLRLQAVLLAPPSLAEGAAALVTELAAATGSERVILGLLNPGMQVIAVSGSAEFKPELALLRQASAAMQEALDQGARVSYPARVTDAVHIILAHAELHARTGHALLSLPLVHAGRAVGALLVEARADTPPGDEHRLLCEGVAAAIGSLVALRQRAERSWHQRLGAGTRSAWQQLARRDDPLPKLALLLALGLALGATLIPVSYRVGAPAHIEGAVQRIVAAPFDGFLQRSHVRPGDTVQAGDLLVEMADHDLALEQHKLESALTQQENNYAAALARADRAQFVISQGKADEARSQLELVRQQLARTRLLAPIDGVIIRGDLSQALGAPVQRGDALLTLAPRAQYRLIVEVDERDIADIRAGQAGHLALASLPSQTLPLVVERVTPVAGVRDGRNVFDVEARLTGTPPELRPGLQGVAKIDAGEQSFAWIWTHRIVDGLRLAWWSWVP